MHRCVPALELLCALLLCPVAPGQQAPWQPLELGTSGLGTVHQRGKLILREDPAAGRLHLFNAFTRSWQDLAFPGGASLRHANDWALVVDGTTWTALSSMSGAQSTRTLSSQAALVNPTTQRNDSIALIRDGTTFHAFSGLTGRWHSLVAPLGAFAAVQRHVAVVAAGSALWGLSAFDGGWVAAQAPAAVQGITVDGTCGLAESGGFALAFSAQHGSWSQAAVPVGATFHGAGDVAVWNSDTQALAYSGLTGTFKAVATGAAGTVHLERQLAVVALGPRTLLFAGVAGVWREVVTASVPTVHVAGTTALLQGPGVVHGFSALTGVVAALPLGAAALDLSRCVGAVVDAQRGVFLFSSLPSTWHGAPAAAGSALPELAAQGALLQGAGTVHAFSARTGGYFQRAVSAAVGSHVDGASALVAVSDGQELAVFDGRLERWLAVPLQAPAQVVLWRTCLVAADGQSLFGYGAQSGRFETMAAPGALGGLEASSEVGWAQVGGTLWAFSPLPEVLTQWQFPAFRRLFTLGTQVRGRVVARSSETVLLGFGLLGPSPVALPGLGALVPDPGTLSVGSVPGRGHRFTRPFTLPAPTSPALQGVEVFLQCLVSSRAGHHLTAPASLMVW